MTKLIFILLLTLLTAHTAHAESPDKLPDRFLGIWEGSSRSTAYWSFDIRGDGVIYHLTPKKRDYDALDNYRFITVDSMGRAYLLRYNHDNFSHKTHVEIVRLAIEEETGHFGPGRGIETMRTLEFASGFCTSTVKDFAAKTHADLITWLHSKDCDVDDKRHMFDTEYYSKYQPS